MKLELIPSSAELAEISFSWRKQEGMVHHNPLMLLTLDELRDLMAKECGDLSQFAKQEKFRWFAKLEGEVVANVSLKNINRTMGYAEISYGVDESFCGRGIGTAAVSMVLNEVFEKTPLRKVMAYVHDENLSSCRLLEKLGFTREGLLRKHYIINGKPENEALFGLLREEFNGVAGDGEN